MILILLAILIENEKEKIMLRSVYNFVEFIEFFIGREKVYGFQYGLIKKSSLNDKFSIAIFRYSYVNSNELSYL